MPKKKFTADDIKAAERFGRAKERARIVRLLRKRAKAVKQFTWYHPDISLGLIADEVEALK